MLMLPDYPILKQKLSEKFVELIQANMEKDPLLARIRKSLIHEGDSLTVTSMDGYKSQTDYPKFESRFSVGYDELIKKGPDAFFEKASEVSREMTGKVAGNVMAKLDEVTKRTGNVVQGKKGKGITPHLILDAIEKMEIDFDEKGNPIMPEIHVTPDVMKKLRTQKLDPKEIVKIEKRRKQIIEKKRKEWIDRESNRKLVD
jgi:hypothetical protein